MTAAGRRITFSRIQKEPGGYREVTVRLDGAFAGTFCKGADEQFWYADPTVTVTFGFGDHLGGHATLRSLRAALEAAVQERGK